MSDSVRTINAAVDALLDLCTCPQTPPFDVQGYLLEAERNGQLTADEAKIVAATVACVLKERSGKRESKHD